MAVRVFLIFVCISLTADGCKEPFDSVQLAVTSFVNFYSGQAQTFTYRQGKLSTYAFKKSSTVSSSMIFHFQGERLSFITSDSTQYSYARTVFYNQGDGTIIDSTFYYRLDSALQVDSTALRSVRIVKNATDEKPVFVGLKTWTVDPATKEVVFAEEYAELTWQDGNVSHLTTSDFATGEKVVTKDVSISYDGKPCVYMDRPEYLFTLALKELFWLSSSNPVTFNDGATNRSYSYNYNKIGYPSSFENDTGTTYGMSYTQIR